MRRRVAHLVRAVEQHALPEHVDAVLLSHLHRDHADLPTLRRLPGVPVIGPLGTASLLARTGTGRVRELRPGGTAAVGELAVRATPAAHDGRRNPLADAAETIGFLVEGSRRVYFAGDTDLFDGMLELADPAIDLALLPVWGWGRKLGPGHLDPARAVRAVAMLRPRVVVPVHWGTYAPVTWRRAQAAPSEEPARRFAELVARETPDVDVVVLRPGQTLELPS